MLAKHTRIVRAALSVVLLLNIVLSVSLTRAVDSPIILQLALSDFAANDRSGSFLRDFEASHPNVKVRLVDADLVANVQPPSSGVVRHLEALQQYASSADVLFANFEVLTTESTRAGLFLDLAPLIKADNTFSADDFYPAAWASFQWDGAIWALPTSEQLIMLNYDPAAFDRAGLTYPDEHWTLTELVKAVQTLAQKDSKGRITSPGMDVMPYHNGSFFRSLVEGDLVSGDTTPEQPLFTQSGVENLLTVWAKLVADGYIGRDLDKAPLSITPLYAAIRPNDTRRLALLPGGRAGISTQAFAVSAGTRYPDLAYELAKFLTIRTEIANQFDFIAARKSLRNGPRADTPFHFKPELDSLIDKGIANGLPVASYRYFDYFALALQKVVTDKRDAGLVLAQMQQEAASNVRTAEARKGSIAIVILVPEVPVLPPGKITLRFDLGSFSSPLPNRQLWQTVIRDFVSTDPAVGNIEFTTNFDDLQTSTQSYDCFYRPHNAVTGAKLDKLLSLDSLMAADPAFDKSDFPGNILTQLQVEHKTWGYPLTIDPGLLIYNSEEFRQAGVSFPVDGWTVDQFVDTLKLLKKARDGGSSTKPIFVGSNNGSAHLLMLIAAYGGVPLDYRTDPTTVNFTAPATVQAIQQVLDLARQGYIKYEAIGTLKGITVFWPPFATLFTTESALLKDFLRGSFRAVLFPRGTTYSVVGYNVGAAYISAAAQNPEACYRWLTTVARHPELFDAQPARRSMLNDAKFTATQPADAIRLYHQIDALLQVPETIAFPSMYDNFSPTDDLMEHWLDQAFDAYVLQNADLAAALADAEAYTRGFQACLADLPPADRGSSDAMQSYSKQMLTCAAKIDPRLKPYADSQK